MKPARPNFIRLSEPSVDDMSSLCFVCGEQILSQQHSAIWKLRVSNSTNVPEEDAPYQDDGGAGYVGRPYHELCLKCAVCALPLTGTNFTRAKLLNGRFLCDLHFGETIIDVDGNDFMRKLREFKAQSLGCAVARRKSSTTLQFPIPAQACLGPESCEWYPHSVKSTPGYWIECSRQFCLIHVNNDDSSSDCETKRNEPNESNPSKAMSTLMPPSVTIQKSTTLEEIYSRLGTFELTTYEEETYQTYFHGSEHWNYFTNDEALGPVILSLKQETCNSRDQFRVMVRTVSYCIHGMVPASSVCADRYDREDVVKSLGYDIKLKPTLKLGQLPSTPDELLKLDQVFIKSELKVGVVFVKENQLTEDQILDNTSHSVLFEEFLTILGERISLRGFDKYKGGLDTVHDLTGTHSVYTAWRGIEIMFHVSTLLPHEENDPQQLQRKRHIGNDIVCVVFLEAGDTQFSPACIKSHFLHTFIIVRTSPTKREYPTRYEISVVSRDEVGAYKPFLHHQSMFKKGPMFREWLLTKIINGERASYSAPKFARMQDRTRSQMLEDIVTNLQNHAETGQIPKPYRRGSWRPIGHMRPSSPLQDSVRDSFEGYESLAKDFAKAFKPEKTPLFDIVFNVGTGKEKSKVFAARAILAVRSRVFQEMLYGIAGYGTPQSAVDALGTGVNPNTSTSATAQSSNFLQVPQLMEPPRQKSAPNSPVVIRAFSRLGNWTSRWDWGGKRSSINTDDGLKRWASESNCGKDKQDSKSQAHHQPQVAGTTMSLSVCADAHKVDRNKLCQTEFNIIEFDSETFRLLMEYLHTGSCVLTCLTVPGLICSAEHYDLPELLQACFHHARQFMRISAVCPMLNVLENYYWRYTSASELMTMVLQFCDTRSTALFSQHHFLDLSESTLQMILGRDLIGIAELEKFNVMLKWTLNKIKNMERSDPRELHCTMNRLTRDLKLHKIPPQELIKVVLPTKTISNEKILETLLYQANTGIYRIQPSYFEACRTYQQKDKIKVKPKIEIRD
ncbi:Uncharacterised protein g6651 [Pycnogonum litorale]